MAATDRYLQNYDLNELKDYPYASGTIGQATACKPKGGGYRISKFFYVVPYSVFDLKDSITYAPTIVSLDSSSFAFKNYESGVLSTQTCGEGSNHWGLAVGYGVLRNEEYILVKNSYGLDWGEGGYVKIAASDSNICGILNAPSRPVPK